MGMEYLGTLALVVIGWALAVFALFIAGSQIYQVYFNFSRRTKEPRKTKFEKAIEKAMLDLDRWEPVSGFTYDPYLVTAVIDSKANCTFKVSGGWLYFDGARMNFDSDKVEAFLFSMRNREVSKKLSEAYLK